MSAPTLTDFLLERFAEDEAAARAVEHGREPIDRVWHPWVIDVVRGVSPQAAVHIARHDPARVLAECEAKRRIVREAVYWRDKRPHSPNAESFARWLLLEMAKPYADHPDWREEWRP